MVEPGESPHEMMDELLANLYGFYAGRARSMPGAQVEEGEGLLLINSGLPNPELNIAFLTEDLPDPAAAVGRAREFLGGTGFWRFEAPVDATNAFGPSLEQAGLTEKETRPALTLVPERAAFEGPPDGFQVIEVESPAQRRQFYETLSLGFMGRPLPPGLQVERAQFEGATPYLGLFRGVPVATSLLYTHEGIAGIYAVTTLESSRGKGFGRAISEAAVHHGFRRGCDIAFLQTTEMARRVYEAIGFKHAFDHTVWRTPA